MVSGHLHNEEESGDDDIGEVPGQEGEEESSEDAVLCAHTGGCYCYCLLMLFVVIVIVTGRKGRRRVVLCAHTVCHTGDCYCY